MITDPRLAILLLHLAAAAVMLWLPWVYTLGAVLFYMIAMPIVQLVSHDYLCHAYMRPRNRVIEAVSLWIFCMLGGRVTEKISFHREHHRYWKDPNTDPTQRKISVNNVWLYVLGLGQHVPHEFPRHEHPVLAQSSIMRFFDQHAMLVRVITVSTGLILLPLEMMAVMFVLFPWMMLLVFNYHDWHFHGPRAGKDSAAWFLLFNTACWHLHHHRHPRRVYFGPGKWRWFNLSWYFYRSCFVPA